MFVIYFEIIIKQYNHWFQKLLMLENASESYGFDFRLQT